MTISPRLYSAIAAGLAILLAPAAGLAQRSPNRLGTIDRSLTGVISHNVSGRLRQATDQGQAPLTRRLEGVTLHFSRTAAQQTALDQLLIDQQTPTSPKYHQWLTPAQFGAQFGLSASDLAKVSAWLTSQNLAISYTAPSSSLIMVSGTVAQLQTAFGTSIHTVTWNGEQHIANVTDPVVPSALAQVIGGITGLNDFRLKARARRSVVSANAVKPAFTASDGTSHYLAPGDVQTIYNAKPLVSSAINGTGITIAVAGQTDISPTDFAAFRAAGALPASTVVAAGAGIPTTGPFLATVLGGTSDPGSVTSDLAEAMLDVEWAGAVAPNVGIIYVNSTDVLNNSLAYAITSHLAPILSISYGLCEPEIDAASIYSFSSLLQQANALGETVIAPGGDSGATDCDYSSVTAADGLAVDFPGSSPNATAVGGTMFNDTAANWSTTNAADGSSALGYIPETVWNETSTYSSLAAGGGGASIYFPKPSWQVGTGVPADFSRDVPDLALNAGAANVSYLVCVNGACANNTYNTKVAYGGTSVGVPSFAGILALVEQKIHATSGLGNINPTLYGLGGSASFHDITTGNNNSPCINGSPNCQGVSSIGYSAAAGYDLASGWGSVDANILANAWATAVPTSNVSGTGSNIAITTVSLPSSGVSCGINSGSITVNIAVAPTSGLVSPTGTVQLLVDGVATGSAVSLVSGAATLTTSTTGLSSGAHNVAALYSGDANFASSKGYLAASLIPAAAPLASPSIIDIVSSTSQDFSLTPCLPAVTVASGGVSSPITLTATSFNGFSGGVTFTVSTDASLSAQFAFSASNPVTLSASSPATNTLTLTAYTTSSQSSARASRTSSTNHLSRRGLVQTGAGTAALASVLFLVLPRRRRYVSLLVAVLSVGALGLAGCGGGSSVINSGGSTGTTRTNTPSGTYIVNVTASGTNSVGQALVHTSILTVTVQ